MRGSINFLLAIGIITNLIKGGDLLLRNSQKKKLQDRFETFTLWIDGLRPLSWLSSLPKPRPALWWSISSAIFSLIAPIGALGGALAFNLDLIANAIRALAHNQGVHGPILAYPLLIGAVLAVPASIFTLRTFSRPLVAWLVGQARFWPFLPRLALFYGLSTGILALFWWICRMLSSNMLIAVGLLLLWPFTFIIYFLNTTGLLIVSLYILIRPINWIVKFVGAICWRVAEYSQGVFAAFLLIATIALGLTKLVMDKR
jgi:hypothetical protein